MQTLIRGPQVNTEQRKQPVGIIVTAIVLFALAGLLSGFAIGGFVRSQKNSLNNLPNQTSTSSKKHTTPTPTPTASTDHPIPMGIPVVDNRTYVENADGSTIYMVNAHAVYKTGEPISSSAITCKIWLTKDGNVSQNITSDRLRSVTTLDQPFPKEEVGSLTFSASTPQTQVCNNGQGTWNYTVSTSVHPGLYYIVVLMDWGGVHYNWSWFAIRVKSTQSN